jgi:hypothetical protein
LREKPRGLISEAAFAVKIYAMAALVGAAATIVLAKLGHPLFGPPQQNISPRSMPLQMSPLPASPAGKEGIPMVNWDAIPTPPPIEAKKVAPKDPSLVVGVNVFDSTNKFFGRVVKVSTAPSYYEETPGSPPHLKELKTYIYILDPKTGGTQAFEYRQVEWKAIPSKNEPEWGVLLTATAPSDPR